MEEITSGLRTIASRLFRSRSASLSAMPEGDADLSLIDEREVTKRILRHLGLWQRGVRIASGPDPPSELVIEPCLDDVFSISAQTILISCCEKRG